MSVRMMSAVGDLNLESTMKFVLIKYADHADDFGRSTFPSYDRISRWTSYSRSTVKRCVRKLRDDGVLVEQGAGLDGKAPWGRGRKLRGKIYCINLGRARRLYGYWSEAADGTIELIRPDEAEKGLTETPFYEPPCEPDEVEKGVSVTPISDSEKGVTNGEKGVSEPEKGVTDDRKGAQSLTPESSSNPQEPSGRQGAAASSAGERAAPCAAEPPPACAVWRDNLDAIKDAVGDYEWRIWLSQATPMSDENDTLTLAVPSRLVAAHIQDELAHKLRGALGRTIRCQVTLWAGAAAAKRAQP